MPETKEVNSDEPIFENNLPGRPAIDGELDGLMATAVKEAGPGLPARPAH
jgi:hypothetical protein